jgi:hypothetical protein
MRLGRGKAARPSHAEHPPLPTVTTDPSRPDQPPTPTQRSHNHSRPPALSDLCRSLSFRHPFTGTLWLHVFCLFKTHAGGVGLASLQSNPSRLAERTGPDRTGPDRTGLATEIKTNKNEISQLGILQTKIINRIRNKKKTVNEMLIS